MLQTRKLLWSKAFRVLDRDMLLKLNTKQKKCELRNDRFINYLLVWHLKVNCLVVAVTKRSDWRPFWVQTQEELCLPTLPKRSLICLLR